jgi:hypothetical protein
MNEELHKGDMVQRVIASHYTGGQRSDAIGIVLMVRSPIARVYFYDTNREELWNTKVLKKVTK